MKKAIGALVLLLGLSLFLAPAASAQYVTHPPPVDSAYWWTLSEDTTPQELFEALQSRELNRSRLLQAIEEGRHEPVSQARAREISLFIDGGKNPELFPMWDVFSSYTARALRPDFDETAPKELVEAGLSEAGASQVVAQAHHSYARRDQLSRQLHAEQVRFAREVVGPAEKTLGKGRAAMAFKTRDFGLLAHASGKARDQVRDMYATWDRDPSEEAAIPSLVLLHSVLAPEDWEAFQRYLLTEVAPFQSYSYFSERPLR